MKLNFLIDDPKITDNYKEKYEMVEYPAVPRVGESVVIHREGTRSYENKFVVTDVLYIMETRDWYLKQKDPALNHDKRIWIYLQQKENK